MARAAQAVILRHVPWEGAHRIAEHLGDLDAQTIDVLAGQDLPDPSGLAGAVIMGGPMGVGDTERYPDLVREKRWIDQALFHELPLVGVCLGAQLIAEVLGAEVKPAPTPEIGWAPVSIVVPEDPLVGPLAPQTVVLHWHGDQFATPPGATLLARSAQTDCQAFRHGSAWGLLFHLEADVKLVETWLGEESMAAEARAALGAGFAQKLRVGARAAEARLVERSGIGLEAFGSLVRERRAGKDHNRPRDAVNPGRSGLLAP